MAACAPTTKPPPLVRTAPSLTKRCHPRYLICPSLQACGMSRVRFPGEGRIWFTAPVLEGPQLPGGGRAGATPVARSLSPGRRAGPPPPLRAWGRGPLHLRRRSAPYPDPEGLHAPPHRLTLRSRQTASGRTGKLRLRRPGERLRRPTLRGDGGGGHQKAFGLLGQENPSPVKRLTCPSRSAARFRFPAYPVGRPTPHPRGVVGISKARGAAREGSRVESAGLRGRAETTTPSR